jgi:hypothetical protein
MSNVLLDFYSILTLEDGVPIETLIYSQVGGNLEVGRQIVSENVNQTSFIQLLNFYPSKFLINIVTGMVVKNGSIIYSVQYEETYSDHQEIFLRKNNP